MKFKILAMTAGLTSTLLNADISTENFTNQTDENTAEYVNLAEKSSECLGNQSSLSEIECDEMVSEFLEMRTEIFRSGELLNLDHAEAFAEEAGATKTER